MADSVEYDISKFLKNFKPENLFYSNLPDQFDPWVMKHHRLMAEEDARRRVWTPEKERIQHTLMWVKLFFLLKLLDSPTRSREQSSRILQH